VTGDNLVTGDPGPSAGVMSSNSDTGSGDRVQARLDVIMRCLDNIELKLEPLQPLPTRVDALEAAATNQDQHHQELRDAVDHFEAA
jgi:hypothetical protein